MKSLFQRITLGVFLAAVVGCSATGGANAPANEGNKSAGKDSASPQLKNAATLRFTNISINVR